MQVNANNILMHHRISVHRKMYIIHVFSWKDKAIKGKNKNQEGNYV